MWVVDSSDSLRLDDAAAELRALLSEERLAGATLLVFANKQDLAGSLSHEQIRDVSAGHMWDQSRHQLTYTQALGLEAIASHKWRIVPCSAISGVGLDEGLDWVVGEVAGRLYWSGRKTEAAVVASSDVEQSAVAPAPAAGSAVHV